MGSSAKTGKKFFEGHRSTFWIKMQFGIGHPTHLHINCSLHVWGRVQESQIFKGNSIISIRSKVMAFLVILLSPWSPCCPCHPHIIPIAPRRSPCGPHGCGLHGLLCCLCGFHPMLSPWSPRRPHGCGLHGLLRGLHPMWSPSSPHHPEGSHIIPNPPDTHFTHSPPPWGVGGPKSVKMQ